MLVGHLADSALDKDLTNSSDLDLGICSFQNGEFGRGFLEGEFVVGNRLGQAALLFVDHRTIKIDPSIVRAQRYRPGKL